MARSADEDVPRRPHDTVLYGIVRVYLDTFLEHLGLQSAPISRAPARDPTWEQGDFRFDEPA